MNSRSSTQPSAPQWGVKTWTTSVNSGVVIRKIHDFSFWIFTFSFQGSLSRSDSQSFNKVAERVLLRLQEKLKGVEEGTVLSIGGQVNLLIQQAMDPRNLSRLFPGWQAWV